MKVSKDGGAAVNIATLPTFVTDVGWRFTFTDAELAAARVNVNIVDAATKAIEDQHFVIETYGAVGAKHDFDLDSPTVTVATNNDKTGYQLAANQAVNTTQVAGTAVSGPDDLKADVSNLDAAVSSRSTFNAGSDTVTLAAAHDVYHADIELTIDEANTRDEYTVTWFKNGLRVTSGITTPTLQVVARADGADLIASTALTQIGSTGSYKHDEPTNRLTAGQATIMIVSATIDSATRSYARVASRDSTAAP